MFENLSERRYDESLILDQIKCYRKREREGRKK